MTVALLAALLAGPARAQAPSLQWIQSVGNSQSTQAFNSNFLALQNSNRNNLVKAVQDVDCSVAGGGNGGALVGATEKGGYIYGGSCQVIVSTVAAATVSSVSGTTVTLTSYSTISGEQHNLLSSSSAAGYTELAWKGFNAFSSSLTWTFSCEGNLPTLDSRVFLVVNGDWAQGNYDYINQTRNSSAGSLVQTTAGQNKWCLLTNNDARLNPNSRFFVRGTFRANTGTTNTTTFDYVSDAVTDTGVRVQISGTCNYAGSAVVNVVHFFFWDPAGTGPQAFQGACKLGVVDN